MGVYSVRVCLSSSPSDGGNIRAEEFIDTLSILPADVIEDVYSGQGPWATSRVEFLPVLLTDLADADEPTEAFAAATRTRLLEIADFLDRQSATALAEARGRGLRVYLYMEVRIDQDQMELSQPAKFLESCARLDLDIELISNDISAAAAVALGWV